MFFGISLFPGQISGWHRKEIWIEENERGLRGDSDSGDIGRAKDSIPNRLTDQSQYSSISFFRMSFPPTQHWGRQRFFSVRENSRSTIDDDQAYFCASELHSEENAHFDPPWEIGRWGAPRH